MLCYRRFFAWRTTTQKSDLECFIVENIFDKRKARRAKVVHHTRKVHSHLPRKDRDDPFMSRPEKFHSEH